MQHRGVVGHVAEPAPIEDDRTAVPLHCRVHVTGLEGDGKPGHMRRHVVEGQATRDIEGAPDRVKESPVVPLQLLPSERGRIGAASRQLCHVIKRMEIDRLTVVHMMSRTMSALRVVQAAVVHQRGVWAPREAQAR